MNNTYLELKWLLFLKVNPAKQGLFNKGQLGSRYLQRTSIPFDWNLNNWKIAHYFLIEKNASQNIGSNLTFIWGMDFVVFLSS